MRSISEDLVQRSESLKSARLPRQERVLYINPPRYEGTTSNAELAITHNDIIMPSAVSPNARAGPAAPDDLDNLFNYDDAVEDFLKDLPIEKNQQNNTTTTQEPSKNIDEEIRVKKKRKPVPKLDENLLQSNKGLPNLRRITKSRLKFRGTGHEFTDMSKLLNTYQLWLDELYPRVKFRDGLAMVEKLGHTKRMQVMRRAWLDDTKPSASAREPSPDELDDTVMSGALPTESARVDGDRSDSEAAQPVRSPTLEDTAVVSPKAQQSDDAPDDDELDALMAEDTIAPKPAPSQPQRQRGPFDDDDDEEEDDLAALLQEKSAPGSGQAMLSTSKANTDPPRNGGNEDDFADEEEAMADMDMW